MAIRTEKTTLQNRDGNPIEVETTTFAGSYGVELFSRVFLIVVPIALPLMSTNDKKSLLDQNIDFGQISKTLVTKMNEKSIVSLVLELCKSTIVTTNQEVKDLSKRPVFDEFFSGEYKLLFEVLKFVLEANFSDFFGEDGIGKYVKLAMEKIQKGGK